MKIKNNIVRIAILTTTFLVLITIITLVTRPTTFLPSPTPIAHYLKPSIKKNDTYTIIFVGDSMIDSLGENLDYLRKNLKDHYPYTTFGLFNYGYGSTNILSLKERLNSETTYRSKTNQAILERELDIIVIGSFGHNPLSELPIKKGLKIQEEVLDDIVLQLVTEKPNTLIIFLAELAPSESSYAMGVVDLSQKQRTLWVNERKAYIENHIGYAIKHNIPLINTYREGMVKGDVNLDYINKDDYIHPSTAGVIFMGKTIADFLHNTAILP